MLDIDVINLLFKIYDKVFLKKVWEERILRQEPYYHGLNRFFAWFYFGIKDPDEYKKNLTFISISNGIVNQTISPIISMPASIQINA